MAATAKHTNRLADLSSDEETEDDGDQQRAPLVAQVGSAAPAGEAGTPLEGAVAEELLVEKKRAAKRKFTEDMLIGPGGLSRLYETFPIKCKMRGRSTEAADLNRLISMYNEWAYQLFPGVNTADLLDTVGKMGSKPAVKAYMNRLRDTERDRYIVDVLKMDLPSAAAAVRSPGPAGSTSPEDNDTPGPPHSAANTPRATQESAASEVAVEMPEFNEACLQALEAAMARQKGRTIHTADFAPTDQGDKEKVADSAKSTNISADASTGNNLVVEMSDDEEMELNFDEFDKM